MPVKPPRTYYVPVANEEQVVKAAYRQGLSIALKGPTGCGKTRFVEAMAHDLDRPLVTVSCHDDLTTADLVRSCIRALQEDGLPALGITFGATVAHASTFPLDWGAAIPLYFMRAPFPNCVPGVRAACRGRRRSPRSTS